MTATPEIRAAVDLRQSRYREIGTAFKAINDELKIATPYLPAVRRSALQIHELARDLPNWFPDGSGPESGLDTKARAGIWQRREDFRRANLQFSVAAEEFVAAVTSGDSTLIASRLEVLKDTCSGCHEGFRVDDE